MLSLPNHAYAFLGTPLVVKFTHAAWVLEMKVFFIAGVVPNVSIASKLKCTAGIANETDF